MKRKRLGETLRDKGKISNADLQGIIAEQQGKLVHLGELMLDRGLVGKTDLVDALEEVSGIPYLDCGRITPTPAALRAIPQPVAERLMAVPIRVEGKYLIVAMATPQNLQAVDELRFTCGLEIAPRQAFRSEIRTAIAAFYGASGRTGTETSPDASDPLPLEEIEFFSTSSRQSNQEAIAEMQADLRQRKTPAVRLVSEIIQKAISKQASDIHIEPQATDTTVRIRVDGVLRDLQTVPRALQNSLTSRIKILSDMDIAERRAPQDGRFMVTIGTRPHDLRVSTLPTQYGEKVVIRLLESSAPLNSLTNLGMTAETADSLLELLSQPQGMILVTGPTGSGKSTTLYSCLEKLRKPAVNIVTVEDPVEYVLPGVNQAHVNTKAGLTFAGCLRSILRQDPNIIMVGEIRDLETAEIAMKAAQTGHLVLSTLHTNDSVSAVVRLLDLGIPGFLISSSVTGIVAQRLVRKLCSCYQMQPASAEFQARLARAGAATVPDQMAVAVGCPKCDHTGYKGRIGIYELLKLDETIRSLIRSGASLEQMREASQLSGMRLMQEDAIDKLRAGFTTVEEILRVVPIESNIQQECIRCGRQIFPLFRYCPHCGTKNALHSDFSKARALRPEQALHK